VSPCRFSLAGLAVLVPVVALAGPGVEQESQQLARSLGDLYLRAGGTPQQPNAAAAALEPIAAAVALEIRAAVAALELKAAVAALGSSLTDLSELQKSIRERDYLGRPKRDSLVQRGALQHGAVAWLHAWGAFGQLAERTKDRGTRSSLLSLKAPSALSSLLSLHGVLFRNLEADRKVFTRFERATSTLTWERSRLETFLRQEKDPLQLALWGRAPGLWAGSLRHRERWGPRADWGPVRGIPTTSELVGRPSDSPRVQRGMLTVWALINLELDRARRSPEAKQLRLKPLAIWLDDLAALLPEAGLSGTATVGRLKRLAAFLRFREAVQDAQVRHRVVASLRNHWISSTALEASATTIRAAKETRADPALIDLLDASQALGGKALPQARIWLRYLVLRSYLEHGLGGAVHPKRGVDPFWKNLTALTPSRRDRGTHDLVRWHAPPTRGHADHALQVLTEGTLRLLQRQKDELSGSATAEGSDALGSLSGYLRKKALPDAKASDKAHANALGRDLRSLHQRLQGSAAPFSPATAPQRFNGPWPLAAYPTLSFKTHTKRLKGALAKLKEAFDAQHLEEDLRHHYQQTQAAYQRSRWAEQRSGIAVEIAIEGRELVRLLQILSKGKSEIAKLREQAQDLLLKAATHEGDASKKRLEKAQELRAVAAGQLLAYQSALDQSEVLIAKAQEQLAQYPPRLIAAAERIEVKNRRAVIFAIAKAVVAVVGAALGPETGGISVTVAQMVNEALTTAEELINADWSNFDNAVGNVAGAVNSSLSIVGVGVKGFGSEKAQIAYADLQQNLTKGIDLGSEGLRMASALVHGNPIHQRLLAMAASQITAEVKDGKLCFEVFDERFDLGLPPEIQDKLKGAIKSGGLLVKKGRQLPGLLNRLQSLEQTVKASKEDWDKLAATERANLERELAKIKQDYPKAREQLKGALNALTQRQRAAVEAKLEGVARRGFPIVVEAGKLVCLVPRAAVRLSQETRKRIKNRATSLAQTAIQDVVKRIKASIGRSRAWVRSPPPEASKTSCRVLAREDHAAPS
jgi:hypothetical protein